MTRPRRLLVSDPELPPEADPMRDAMLGMPELDGLDVSGDFGAVLERSRAQRRGRRRMLGVAVVAIVVLGLVGGGLAVADGGDDGDQVDIAAGGSTIPAAEGVCPVPLDGPYSNWYLALVSDTGGAAEAPGWWTEGVETGDVLRFMIAVVPGGDVTTAWTWTTDGEAVVQRWDGTRWGDDRPVTVTFEGDGRPWPPEPGGDGSEPEPGSFVVPSTTGVGWYRLAFDVDLMSTADLGPTRHEELYAYWTSGCIPGTAPGTCPVPPDAAQPRSDPPDAPFELALEGMTGGVVDFSITPVDGAFTTEVQSGTWGDEAIVQRWNGTSWVDDHGVSGIFGTTPAWHELPFDMTDDGWSQTRGAIASSDTAGVFRLVFPVTTSAPLAAGRPTASTLYLSWGRYCPDRQAFTDVTAPPVDGTADPNTAPPQPTSAASNTDPGTTAVPSDPLTPDTVVLASAQGVALLAGDGTTTEVSATPAAAAYALGTDLIAFQEADPDDGSYPPWPGGPVHVWEGGVTRELAADAGARRVTLLDARMIDGIPVALVAEVIGEVGPDDTFELLVRVDLRDDSRTILVRRPAWESSTVAARVLQDGEVVTLYGVDASFVLARWRPGDDAPRWQTHAGIDTRLDLAMRGDEITVVEARFGPGTPELSVTPYDSATGARQPASATTVELHDQELQTALTCRSWPAPDQLLCGRSDGPPITLEIDTGTWVELDGAAGAVPMGV
jgi:hypothetical protein